MRKLKLQFFVNLLCFVSLFVGVFASAEPIHWRSIAYVGVMAKYQPLLHCIEWTGYQFKLPEELLYSILKQEQGSVNAPGSLNNNKTKDYGPGQINDVSIPELTQFDVDRKMLIENGCANIWSTGYLLRKRIDAAGDFWTGVGDYHYSIKGPFPVHHFKYINQIRKHWQDLYQNFIAKRT